MIRKWTSSGGKERCVRDYARRRVSERNRRKAALSAEITQEAVSYTHLTLPTSDLVYPLVGSLPRNRLA